MVDDAVEGLVAVYILAYCLAVALDSQHAVLHRLVDLTSQKAHRTLHLRCEMVPITGARHVAKIYPLFR